MMHATILEHIFFMMENLEYIIHFSLKGSDRKECIIYYVFRFAKKISSIFFHTLK